MTITTALRPRPLGVHLAWSGNPATLKLIDLADGKSTCVGIADPLPFPDCGATRVQFDEALACLPVRERLHVLLECRRCLAPGGLLVPDGEAGASSNDPLAKLAALVGLEELPPPMSREAGGSAYLASTQFRWSPY